MVKTTRSVNESKRFRSFRPLLVLAGSSDVPQESMGAFQEFPQVEATRLFTKYAARIPSLDRVPFYVEKVEKADRVAIERIVRFSLGRSFNDLFAVGRQLSGHSW